MMTGVKTCSRCKAEKLLSLFYRKKGKPNPECKACHYAGMKSWDARNKETRLGYTRSWRRENPEKVQAYSKAWYAANADKAKHKTACWRAGRAEHLRNYQISTRPRVAARQAVRRAIRLEATPPWADLEKIQAVYDDAARLTEETGVEHHVDHIYPLRGRDGSRGLHVHDNLRVCTGLENRQKSNRAPSL
jgi:hypothetical protein